MTIFRYIPTQQLCRIEHLVQDIRHLNRNAFAGLYVYEHLTNNLICKYLTIDHEQCRQFIKDNLIEIAHR